MEVSHVYGRGSKRQHYNSSGKVHDEMGGLQQQHKETNTQHVDLVFKRLQQQKMILPFHQEEGEEIIGDLFVCRHAGCAMLNVGQKCNI